MVSSQHIKDLAVGPYTLRLVLQDQVPLIERDGQFFNHIWLLAQQMALLSEPMYICQFAELSNFLWKGIQFQYIEDIEAYRRFYLDQVELEQQCPGDLFQYRLTDYKIFDVFVMREPWLEEGQLHYFVYNTTTALPYKVVCPFPYTSASTMVHYQVLPLKSEAPF